MQVVAGWDNDMQKIFSPFLTVYPMPLEAMRDNKASSTFQINFNSAPRELLNCLFPKATTECAEKSALYTQYRADQAVAKDNTSIQTFDLSIILMAHSSCAPLCVALCTIP